MHACAGIAIYSAVSCHRQLFLGTDKFRVGARECRHPSLSLADICNSLAHCLHFICFISAKSKQQKSHRRSLYYFDCREKWVACFHMQQACNPHPVSFVHSLHAPAAYAPACNFMSGQSRLAAPHGEPHMKLASILHRHPATPCLCVCLHGVLTRQVFSAVHADQMRVATASSAHAVPFLKWGLFSASIPWAPW